jgi:hypothetical protein
MGEAGCHDGGAFVPDLRDGNAYEEILCQESLLTDLNYVEPGSSADSYLFHKVDGTQGDVEGCEGDTMPCGVQMPNSFDPDMLPPPLGAADIATIQEWIDGGAPE